MAKPPAAFACPAVSVIIPLYNVEKYIGECLDSLLAQTFQNFEVIVVDDCSTDSSPAVVESYAPKFDGRLTLFHTKKNSGSGTEPRNLGLAYARGEYLYFMDNDDAVTPTALEELYSLAKAYDADVIHCDKYYPVPDALWNNVEYRRQLRPSNYLTGDRALVKEPLIWEDNFEERVRILAQRNFLIWNFWVQLVRRKFLIENSIKMVGVIADDMLFTICEICCAKRYVIVPNAVYFYRIRGDSLFNKQVDYVTDWERNLRMLTEGTRYLDNFLNGLDFFSRRVDLKYLLFEFQAAGKLRHLCEFYAQNPAHAFDELLRKALSRGDNVALTSFVFSSMNVYRLQFMQSQQRIAALEAELKRLRV